MLTPKENYLIAARGGKPEWVHDMMADSCMFALPVWDVDSETGLDHCNIKWIEEGPGLGKMPDATWKAIEDISDWRNAVTLPDPATLDWEKLAHEFFNSSRYDESKALVYRINTHGLFLIPINMMGWVDGLCAIYEDKKSYCEFLDYLCSYLCDLIKYGAPYFKPDIICSGDDVCGGDGPFVSREMFREIYKPLFQRCINAIHEVGALGEFHCCGNNGYLIEELIDMGWDIAQLPMPNEQLLADKKRFGDRLVITGGWARNGAASLEGASEDTVRASVHEAIDTYGKDGALIFWDGGLIQATEDAKMRMAWLLDELRSYGHEVYKN